MKSVSVVGEGAWGTAIAQLLADNGHQVTLWCHNEHIAQEIATERTNQRYMPGITIHSAIVPTTKFAAVMHNSIIFISTPVQYFRSVLEQIKPYYQPQHLLVLLNKGIENNTLLFPTQIVSDVCGNDVQSVVVAGPSFAKEVINKGVTAVIVASNNTQHAQRIQQLLSNLYMHPFLSADVVGVQAGAALKNVFALAMGIAHGAGWCANTKAWLMTQSLHEMNIFTTFLGGNAQTTYGLSGVGDLILTATHATSKNYQVGVALGRGKKLQDILAQTGYIPEGINTVRSVEQLSKHHTISLPICHAVYRYISEQGPIDDITKALNF